MIDTAMTEAEFTRLVEQVWPVADNATDRVAANANKRRLSLVQLFTDSPTNTTIRGTRWAAYQAVTEYLDHTAPVAKTVTDAAATRAERVLTGSATDPKLRAFDLLSA